MRFEITGHWKDGFEHDGLLYCAQRIEEMLMVYTSHIYKVPVYNSFLLAYEYLTVFSLVESETIDKAHLSNIMNEFLSAFTTDEIIKEHFSQAQIDSYLPALKGSSIQLQRRTMDYIIHLLDEYPNWCLEYISKAVQNPREKKLIEKALRAFLPTYIWLGYHPQYIYTKCKRFFDNSEIDNVDVINDFLKAFNRIEKDYTIYFVVDKKINKFKTILESRLNISFEQDDYSRQLDFDPSKQICLNICNSALDANGAANYAFNAFDLFVRYFRFLGNRNSELCGDKCLVRDSNDNVLKVYFGPKRYFYSRDYDDSTLGKKSESVINELIEKTSNNDLYKIDKLIKSHNSALLCSDINNSFLNLWSVLEIVCIDDCESNASKIKHIIDSIVPILKRNYFRVIFGELHDYLKANLKTDSYRDLLNKISEDGSDDYKIACLVLLEKYEDLLNNAYDMLKDYPLIRSRISQLNEDVFKKKRKYKSELERYGQRLTWHIQRLYRVRNGIIHSGEPDDNIVFLVEHLHSYVDEVVLDVIERMTREHSVGSISNVILDAQLHIERIEKSYDNDESFSSADIDFLFE